MRTRNETVDMEGEDKKMSRRLFVLHEETSLVVQEGTAVGGSN